jgi:hypothetical protein
MTTEQPIPEQYIREADLLLFPDGQDFPPNKYEREQIGIFARALWQRDTRHSAELLRNTFAARSLLSTDTQPDTAK